LSTPELIGSIARALGREPALFALPLPWLKFSAACIGRRAALARLIQSLVVDDSEMRRELDWAPPVPLETAMQMTADWYLRMRRQGGGVRARERSWSG
jgi:nucleoside-diphosphate-sugar epimerase